ncbi:hypothetical protein QJS10_CPA05g00074 [Acorus calamus]|uniref:Uncharacterized protein n=1 Tax=Acorus calamus TaxID=4465 RepID=A0AAV9ESR2_ACOCL|nr:hypothetical protein QJS10_CPA05g00074 [Acorus calamus]
MEEDIGEDFEFQVSLSSQSPSESAADRLFRSGRILPLHGLESAAESSYDEKIRSAFMSLVKSYNNILSRRRGPNYYYDQNDHNNESIGIGRRRKMTVDIRMIKDNEIKSCPGSVSSSPIHRAGFSGDVEERETSLRAAIEHYKKGIYQWVPSVF